jgi:hypothetical protein
VGGERDFWYPKLNRSFQAVREIVIRPATDRDAAFASHVTEISMRVYAEETWGAWDGNVNFDIQFDQVIQFGERDKA